MIEMYKYTDKEIKTLLKSMVILIDTNEQVYEHITEWLDKKKIPYKRHNLNYGDYSFMIPINPELGIARDMYFSDKVVIERKRDLNEISGNFANDRLRIESEFIRHKGKMTLMIENAEYSDIIAHKYQTKYEPSSFIGTLHSFSDRYNVPFVFIKDNKYSAQYIYYTFYYFLRNYLLGK